MRTIALGFLFVSLFLSAQISAAQGQYLAMPKGTPHAYYGYWEYLPTNYDSAPTNYALLINLHGAGSQGTGSLGDLARIRSTGPMANVVGGTHYPTIILTPQLAGSSWTGGEMNFLSAFVDWARTNYRVDSNRIYVTGLSLGGGGTWGLAIRRTDLIAAAVPVCGALQPYAAGVEPLLHLPIWATHNSNDGTVPTSWTHGWMKAMSNAGGTFHQTRIFPTSGHNAWTATYNDASMWAWLFSQKRIPTSGDFQAPAALTGTYPSPGQTVSNPKPRIQWKTASDATGLLRHDIEFDGMVYSGTSARAWVPSNPQTTGVHYYRVRAVDKAGNIGVWSPSVSFTVAPGDADWTDEVSNNVTAIDSAGFTRWRDEYFPENLFDNNTNTYYRWTNSIVLTYAFMGGVSKTVDAYSMVCNAAGAAYDPNFWTLSGSPDGVNWTVLDQKTNMSFSSRFERKEFAVANAVAYSRYRLAIGMTNPQATFFINEIELIKKSGAPPIAAPIVTAPANFTTNQPFTLTLSADRNSGFVSTNSGVSWNAFPMGSTNIALSATRTFLFYGFDGTSTSATNTRTYTFDTTAPAVSGAQADLATNAAFTVNLSVNEDSGYWSTNGSPYASFTTTGVSIPIAATTTLRFFGRDDLGNTSPTNTRVYTFTTPPPPPSGAPLVTAPASFTTNYECDVSFNVDSNSGYISTNAGLTWSAFPAGTTNIHIYRTQSFLYYGDSGTSRSATNAATYTLLPPQVSITSGPTTDITTNAPFTITLTVNRMNSGLGGWSTTNASGTFTSFNGLSTNILITNACTLRYFGFDGYVRSATNTLVFTFTTNALVSNTNASTNVAAQANTANAKLLLTAPISSDQTVAKGSEITHGELAFTSSNGDVRLRKLRLTLVDQSGSEVQASQVVSRVELRQGNVKVAEQRADLSHSWIDFAPNLLLQDGKKSQIRIVFAVSADAGRSGFKWRLSPDGIDCVGEGTSTKTEIFDETCVKIGTIDSSYLVIRTLDFAASLCAFPNPYLPSTGQVRIEFSLNQDAAANVAIYTLSGSRVTALCQNKTFSRGIAKLEWDGKNEHGRRVARGVYLVSVECLGEKAMFQVAVL